LAMLGDLAVTRGDEGGGGAYDPGGGLHGVRGPIIVLVSILRSENWISERRVAADDQIGNALIQSQSRLVIKSAG
jgi:hypothetical protein